MATAFVAEPRAADRLPGLLGRRRVVQLAGGPAGDGTHPAALGSEPGQRDLQLGSRHRRGGDPDGRHAPDPGVRLAVVVRGDRLGRVRLGGGLAAPGPGRVSPAAGPRRAGRTLDDDALEAGPTRAAAARRGLLGVRRRPDRGRGRGDVRTPLRIRRHPDRASPWRSSARCWSPRSSRASTSQGADWAAGLGDIVRNRRFWILVVVSVTINICWHFLVNWIPTYLKHERGMNFGAGNLPQHDPVPGRRRRQPAGRLAVPPARRGRPDPQAGAAGRDGRRGPVHRGRRWASGWPRTWRPR